MPCKKIVIIGPESTGKSTLCEGLAAHYGTEWVPEYAREYLELHGMDYTYGDLLTIAKGQLALEDAAADRVLRAAGGEKGAETGDARAVAETGAAGSERAVAAKGAWNAAGAEGAEGDAGVDGAKKGGEAERVEKGVADGPEDRLAGDADGAENGAGLLFIDTDMYVMKVWGEFVFGACDTWILDQIVQRKYDGYLLCNIDLPWSFDKLREYPDEGPRQKLFEIYKDLMINQDVPWALISGQAEERLQAAIAAVDKMVGAG